MINLNFFPSRPIAFYMARLFIVRSLAVLAGLTLVLMMLDLLGNAGDILAVPGNGDADLWRYVGYRVPQLINRFLPFSVLLGTLITLATLNQNSEIVSMKAAGVSAHQIIAPLIVAAFLFALAHFAFNERIVTRANAALDAWEAVDWGLVPAGSGVQSNVAFTHGDNLVFARLVAGRDDAVRLAGITIYERAQGTLRRIFNGETGGRDPGGWRLQNVTVFDVDSGVQSRLPSLVYGPDIRPDQFTLARVDPDERDIFSLRGAIAELRAVGRPTESLEAHWWRKLALPMSSVLMPLLGAVAAFGLARSGQLIARAVIGMALGFAYFVADNFAIAMGNFGAYPPLLAAWGPFFLFLLIGETVLIRTEE
ncbi:LPS export ABC transporter permease LptG [Sphingosinicella sp.]|uniref:LPS export ABC transporter permease LptG n=1 Tax=Sphingosinicella sp. TaxID=1917971 RepID=UPI0040383964